MLFRKTSPMLACLCVAALHVAGAQPGSAFSQSLTATSGLSFNQHLDASASPMPFKGTGVQAGLRYERIAGGWDWSAILDGARRDYISRADAGTSVRERGYDGAVNAALLRSLGRSAESGIAVGIAVDVRGGVLTHQYADPGATATDYVSGYALVGPSARWRTAALGGNAIVRVGVPLVGIAHHPYTDARIDQASPAFHTVGPRMLHALDASIGYESSARRRIGFMTEFRARTLDYADIQRSRMASTALTAGVVMRFGRIHP
jgi:hypothetical protein